MLTDEKIREFIRNVYWTFAKIYAQTSQHEYYLLKKVPMELRNTFMDFVMHINTKGEKGLYKGRTYIVFWIFG